MKTVIVNLKDKTELVYRTSLRGKEFHNELMKLTEGKYKNYRVQN